MMKMALSVRIAQLDAKPVTGMARSKTIKFVMHAKTFIYLSLPTPSVRIVLLMHQLKKEKHYALAMDLSGNLKQELIQKNAS